MIWAQARPLPSLGPSWATQTTPEISNKYEIMILMILTRAPQTHLNITILHPPLDLEEDFGYIYSLDLFSAKHWMLTRFYKIFAVKNVRHSLNSERKNHFTMLYNVLIRILSNATVVFVDALPKIGSRKIWSFFWHVNFISNCQLIANQWIDTESWVLGLCMNDIIHMSTH